jgi:predicted permease
MALLPVILNAFVPIAFVILLGVLAGRTGMMKPSASVLLSALVLDFCLPAELFNSMATISLKDLPPWSFFGGTAIGLLGIFALAFAVSIWGFKSKLNVGALQALNASFPNIAFIGIPIVIAVIGKAAVPYAVVAIVISSLVLPPIALTLLAASSPAEAQHKGAVLVLSSLWGSLKQSVVWAPILGVVFAFAHIPLPQYAQASVTLIGEATTGLALFALGLLLTGQRLKLSAAATSNVLFKTVAQPALMWVVALAFGMTAEHTRVMVICGALPTAPMTAMFAIKYDVYKDESDATILLSTVLSLVTVGAIIAMTM